MIRDHRYLNPVLLIRELFFTNTEFEIILDDELLQKSTDNERILYLYSILNYYKNFEDKIDEIFKDIYENEFQLIPVEEYLFKQYKNNFKEERTLTNEEIEYNIKIEYFDNKKAKIRSFVEIYIPNQINLLTGNLKSENDNKLTLVKGFHYIGKAENLRQFYNKLLSFKIIENIVYEKFRLFFNIEFEPNDNKIVWLKSSASLNYLITKKFTPSKDKFNYPRNKYKDTIVESFLLKNKDTNFESTKINIEKYSANNNIDSIPDDLLSQINSAFDLL